MGRYMTPRGVVVETSEDAARAVGYKPADVPAEKPTKKAPAKESASPKKSD